MIVIRLLVVVCTPQSDCLLVTKSCVSARYAGRSFETEEQVNEGKGALMVKGLKSMWRQAAPILRTTLQGALQRIIMQVMPQESQSFPFHAELQVL